MPQRTKRVFRIENNSASDDRSLYALIDDTDTIVRVHDRPSVLASIGFDVYGADEVKHEYRWVSL